MKENVMLSVQGLIKNCNITKLTDLFISHYFKEEDIIRRYKKRYITKEMSDEDLLYFATIDLKETIKNCITEISNLSQTPGEDINYLCVVKYYEHSVSDECMTDVFTVENNEFANFNPIEYHYHNSYEDLKTAKLYPFNKWSFIFEDWKKVIAYQVPNFVIQENGMEETAAAILYEMTWCGFDYKTAEENRKKTYSDDDCISVDLEELEDLEDDSDEEELPVLKERPDPYEFSEEEKKDMIKNYNDELLFFSKLYNYINKK